MLLCEYPMKRPIFKKILAVITGLFAIIGLIFVAVFIGMEFGVFKVKGSTIERNEYFDTSIIEQPTKDCLISLCTWQETPEWIVIKSGLAKDRKIIDTVANETGIPSRVIASVVVPEQLRYFTADREKFKHFFEPLKILGSLSQFSLGVSGIKQETARQIEKNILDKNSPFYPGGGYENLIAYPSDESDHTKLLYTRLSDPINHYYSYLYTALYIKQIESQWSGVGHPIDTRVGVIATLFNIGFENSKPKENPEFGGAPITLSNNKTYSYGEIGDMFYVSNELTDIFPKTF